MYSQEKADRILALRRLYVESEREFTEFSNIIPVARNPREVYSPRLWAILQGVGSQVDGMLKLLIDEFNLRVKSKKFPAMCKALNKGGMLAAQKITLKEKIEPFNPFAEDNPAWWTAYNATKHDLPDGVYEATLGNTIQALGALFILNHIGNILFMRMSSLTHVSKDPTDMVLKKESWQDFEEEFRKAPDVPSVKIDSMELIPRQLANLQPYRLGSYEWGSIIFYNLSIYWLLWGHVKLRHLRNAFGS